VTSKQAQSAEFKYHVIVDYPTEFEVEQCGCACATLGVRDPPRRDDRTQKGMSNWIQSGQAE
jgi:hypothetical protein